MVSVRASLALLVTVFAVAMLTACESIVDLSVQYVDAAGQSGDGASDASVLGDGAGFDADGATRIDSGTPVPLGNCPCDTAASTGCCIPGGGATPYCTANAFASSCTGAGGMFVACTHYDTTTDSVCCWRNGTGPGAQATYAASCNGDPTSCAQSSDCAGGVSCALASCGNGAGAFTIGVCRATPPTCP